MTPSFSGLLVTWAYLPQTTLPPGVTKPSSLTFTYAKNMWRYVLAKYAALTRAQGLEQRAEASVRSHLDNGALGNDA